MTIQEHYQRGFMAKCAQAGVDPSLLIKQAKPLSQDDFVELRKHMGLTEEAANANYNIYLKRRKVAKALATALVAAQGAVAGSAAGPAGAGIGAGVGAATGLGLSYLMQGLADKVDRNQLEHRRKGEAPSWWAV